MKAFLGTIVGVPTTLPIIACCLLVDDHVGMRALLRDLLAPVVDSFVECADGSGTVVAFAETQPDIVLMDVEMPGKDGLTATRELLVQYPEARVVILTQHDSPELKSAAFTAGARAFLSKSRLTDLPAILHEIGVN